MPMDEPNEAVVAGFMQVDKTWWALHVFNLYRLLLSVILFALFQFVPGETVFGGSDPVLFKLSLLSYIIFSFLSTLAVRWRKPSFHVQTIVQVFVDIFVLTLLIHASRSLTTELGILMNVAIAGGCLLTAGRTSLLFAAIASIAVLTEHINASFNMAITAQTFFVPGVLGLTFFTTALLAIILLKRIHASESLANQRGIDLDRWEQLNELIVRHMRSGVVVIDDKDKTHLLNNSAWQLLGKPAQEKITDLWDLSPMLGKQLKLWRNHSSEQLTSFKAADSAPEITAHFSRLGNRREDKGTLIFLEDVTRLSQYAQQMKLVSLGRLTASIAHEVRNPLAAISHATQLLLESPLDAEDNQRLLDIILQHTRRVNTVVNNILQLSRREKTVPQEVHLDTWLESFIEDIKRLSKDPVEIKTNLSVKAFTVYADPSQLHQVLTNLCENGLRHSQQLCGKKRLNLQLGDADEMIYIDVIDYGVGIDSNATGEVFEPFYTTEKNGTGLGLYIAKELCEANQAMLSIKNVNTGGACFRISFPPQATRHWS